MARRTVRRRNPSAALTPSKTAVRHAWSMVMSLRDALERTLVRESTTTEDSERLVQAIRKVDMAGRNLSEALGKFV